jgi:hypothetical protein
LLLFVACSDDGGDNGPSQADLLTSVSWKFSSVKSLDGKFVVTQVCSTDDVYGFSSDGKVTINTKAEKCGAFEPAQYVGTWSLTNANGVTTLKVESGYSYFSFERRVLELTKSKLVLLDDTGEYEFTYVPAD